jgi:hypothetical protein
LGLQVLAMQVLNYAVFNIIAGDARSQC